MIASNNFFCNTPQMLYCYWVQFRNLTQKWEIKTQLVVWKLHTSSTNLDQSQPGYCQLFQPMTNLAAKYICLFVLYACVCMLKNNPLLDMTICMKKALTYQWIIFGLRRFGDTTSYRFFFVHSMKSHRCYEGSRLS